MKKILGKLLVVMAFCAGIGLCVPGICADAAAKKAVKVKADKSYKNGKEKLTVKGLDRKGKVVWKYTTKSFPAAQCDFTNCVTKKDRVYIFCGSSVRAVKKSNGKKIWVCKKITQAGHLVKVDGKNNLYVTGFLDSFVYKVSAKGKIVWKTNVDKTGNYWPYKMSYKGGKLKIMYDSNDSDKAPGAKKHAVAFSGKTGKILGYY